ncbi:molybdopterin molybdotransferase MoeA [uncultured Adlercreutzia sp.]|uniref:molybdopterin molybdotransferase MoeA n=1 Tax=uncultured Adlercreutzia sp. TaxID=875803 RepID=UPI0025D3AA3E|nr:molybdopterin molybdotransferase MoeA [uncultured Adlercreutzia sp.]MCI9261568.1 molybdopterin molybdotransferase MoeA [Eggerthellaceae bacterium]
MRDHRNHVCADYRTAATDLLAQCTFVRESEEVPVEEAIGRVLAETACALHALPNKPTSNMDAIAVRFADFADGMPDVTTWKRGEQFQFCNTGVAMPDGFDTAIAIENVEVGDDNESLVALTYTPTDCGEAVSPVGSSLEKDTVLVEKGTLLNPVHAALLAQGGYTTVPVVRKPRVAFIPTGNELVDPCKNPPTGKNIDCNSINVCGKLAAWGAEPMRFPIVPDNWDALKAALDQAVEEADIVVINAGSSKGSDDFTCEILEKYGTVLSHETNAAPGKHASCALLNGTPVVGISGPPIAADLNVEMFAKPLVDAFLYGVPQEPPVIYACLAEDMPLEPRRVNLLKRVKLVRDDNGYLWAEVLPLYAPALKECAEADGLLIVPADSYGWHYGEQVPIQLRFPYQVRF